MKKKLLSILLVLSLMLALVPAAFAADEVWSSGTCGKEGDGSNITWTLYKSGLLTFTGTGAMRDYTSQRDTPWGRSGNAIQAVIVQEGVTHIGAYAFFYYTNCRSVSLPSSLVSIGESAFAMNYGLTQLDLPEGLRKLGDMAFMSCRALKRLTVPSTLETIGRNTFSSCGSLSDVTLSEGLTALGRLMFSGDRQLKNITLPQSLEKIDDYAFSECPRLTEINIPDSVTTFGIRCFSRTGLRELTLPEGTTTIGGRAFADMPDLRELHIPAAVTSFGIGVFAGDSSLTTASLPSSLTEIPESTFAFCEKLTSVAIPDSVTSIGKEAFKNCTSLTAIDLPDAVTFIDASAFLDCQSLTQLQLPSALEALGGQAFGGCIGLTSLTVPDGVRKLPSWVFSGCQSLASLSLPTDLTSIGMGAFHGCRSLTEITIPDSVQSIGEMAFANMARLQTIHVGAGNSAYQTVDGVLLTKAGDVLLAYPAARPGIRYDVPDGVTRIGERAFYGSGLMIVRFPQSLRTVADEAFKNSTRLIALDFPAGTEEIGTRAFNRDSNISDVFFGGTENAWYQLVKDEAYKFPLDVQVHYQTSMVVPRAADLFTDVDADSWSYPGIDFCVLAGLMSGVGGDTFLPRGVTTRAQVVQILYNLSGEPAVAGGTPFTDLTADWYQDAIAWAYQTGFVSGMSATTFEPEAPVTREQIAVILMGYAEQVLSMDLSVDKADLVAFPDGDQVSSWAREAMADAVALGIINGTKVGDQVFLAPQGGATREQTATILMGFYTLVDVEMRILEYDAQ